MIPSARAGMLLVSTIAALVALVAIAQGNHVPNEDFPEFSWPYTQAMDGDCQHDTIDPITTAFRGDSGGLSRTVWLVENHAGWTNLDGSPQNLRMRVSGPDYDCRSQGNQRANHGNFYPDRFHIRLWRIPASVSPDLTTVGDAHHEDVTFCGHAVDQNGSAVSGFDRGRDELSEAFFDAGHPVTHEVWGNTRTFQQCDGGYAGSNGIGDLIGMPHPPHDYRGRAVPDGPPAGSDP